MFFMIFMPIKSIIAREIIDSRGNPTVEVDVLTDNGGFGRGVAPSGASTGAYEAVELRDSEKRYGGKGVRKAVENVNKKIWPAIFKDEEKFEKKLKKNAKYGYDRRIEPATYDRIMLDLDGTKNKAKLGANAIVATSMAITKALASSQNKPLYQYIFEIVNPTLSPPGEIINAPPFANIEKKVNEYWAAFGKFKESFDMRLKNLKIPQPMFNILNGGKHAGTKLAIQEFMIIPKGKTFQETLQIACEIYHTLGKILVDRYGASAKNVGDEGGYTPPIDKTDAALDAIMKAIDELGYLRSTSIGIDCAATSFYDSVTKTYTIDERAISGDMLRRYYIDFVKRYPITSIEDPFDEDGFDLFATFTNDVGNSAMVVGDDLLVTNQERIKQAIEKKACNALLLKVNQIGTVSEAMTAAVLAKNAGWDVVASHRSGETEDTFIADFAVGIGVEYIKTGAPARGERTAKYNQLLRIEEMLMEK